MGRETHGFADLNVISERTTSPCPWKTICGQLISNSHYPSLPIFSNHYAMVSLSYSSMTTQKVVYKDDYSFWEFMGKSQQQWNSSKHIAHALTGSAEVGGVLGLYFGITIITVYEMLAFLFVDREPHEGGRQHKEHEFSRKRLYKRDRNIRVDQAIPTIF